MSTTRGFLGNHTYSCALPVRGGVCNCQSDQDPSTDLWPYLFYRDDQQKRGGSASQQPGGVNIPVDAGVSGMAAERGMGLVGMVTSVDQDPSGPVTSDSSSRPISPGLVVDGGRSASSTIS